jgi:alpha-tubulin suppressor-like RCC1 family protein
MRRGAWRWGVTMLAPIMGAWPDVDGVDRRSAVASVMVDIGEAGRTTTVTGHLRWPAGAAVRLRGRTVVRAGGHLEIGPGVHVMADSGAGLVIERDARATMQGTLLQPVIFRCGSSEQTSACWQGLTIDGWAPINHGTLTSPAARGVGAAGCREAIDDEASYGGCDPADSSGVFRFVRVENAIDGLRLRGVGSRTVVEHIQVHRALGDGLTVTGGTVDVRYVALTVNAQFGLHWRGGWTGRAQFVIVQPNPAAFAGGIRGANAMPGGIPDALPRSAPVLEQVTVLATSFASNPYASTPVRALVFERGTAGALRNLYVARAPITLDIDDDATCQQLASGALSVSAAIVASAVQTGDPDADPAACAGLGASPGVEAAYLTRPGSGIVVLTDPTTADTLLVSSASLVLPDLRPRFSAAIFRGAAAPPSGPFFDAADYVGGVEPAVVSRGNIPWYSGWTEGGALPLPPAGTIAGRVTSPLRGPLPGVRIGLQPLGASAITPANGAFSLAGVPAGPYVVEFSSLPSGCAAIPPQSRYLAGGATDSVLVSVACVPASDVALDAGLDHTCGLDRNGFAWCWGAGGFGQLGTGASDTTDIPVAVTGGKTFQAISAGNRTTCGLDTNRRVFCWGSNAVGQLGINAPATAQATVPVAVASSETFLNVSVGAEHACAVAESGAGYCWGSGNDGKLGNGTLTRRDAPTPVFGGLAWRVIAAGSSVTCGVAVDGSLWCWGSGVTGGLGNPGVAQSSTPVPVTAPAGVAFTKVSVGSSTACAIATTGASYCWGTNVVGQTGTGTVNVVTVPTLVAGGTSWRALGLAGEPLFLNHACGIATSGTALCWGLGDEGQLAQTAPQSCFFILARPCATAPLAVPAVMNAVRIATGGAHSCVLTAAGVVSCWGRGSVGQLGDGTRTGRSAPAPVAGSVPWPVAVVP